MVSTLDFSLLPDLQQSAAFVALDSKVELRLAAFAEVLDRAWAAIYFCYNINGSPETLRTTTPNLVRAREASLRASLAEFSSIEDALEREATKKALTKPLLRANDTPDPLLHLIRELRHLEIHLQTSRLTPHPITVLFGGPTSSTATDVIETEAWCIQELTPSDFGRLRNARHYDPAQVNQLLTWFNSAQRAWGIYELIRVARLRYTSRIVDYYGL